MNIKHFVVGNKKDTNLFNASRLERLMYDLNEVHKNHNSTKFIISYFSSLSKYHQDVPLERDKSLLRIEVELFPKDKSEKIKVTAEITEQSLSLGMIKYSKVTKSVDGYANIVEHQITWDNKSTMLYELFFSRKIEKEIAKNIYKILIQFDPSETFLKY